MSLVAGATLLGGLSHLANLGQFAEIGQAHAYQKEQMQWARRAYCLDSRALRIDLLNAVKEDVRDHHQTYAGRIDTLLLVHTLLLTFALATLQYSDQFVPSSECIDCEEVEHPWMVLAWVYSVSGILILPFWSIVMLIWSKLQLDHWLENALWRLNHELRSTLSTQASPVSEDLHEGDGMILLERVEGAVGRLSGFVVEHQDSFRRIWNRECRAMIKAATVFLWASCVLAIGITAGMFWLFLENHMQGAHKTASTHFAIATLAGLLAPAAYAGWYKASVEDPGPVTAEVFEDCIELPPSIGSTSVTADRDSLDQDRLRLVGRRLLAMGRRAARVIRWNRGGGLDLDSQQPCLDSGGQSPQLWSPMLDEGVSMTDMSAIGTRPLSEEGVAWMDLESGTPPDCR